MYKKKEGTSTDNKDRFLRRKQRVGESITEFAAELKDVLYQAWPGMPRDQLEDLLVEYFVGELQSPETSAKVKLEKPKSIVKAIDIAEIYEDLINKNTSMMTNGEFLTPQSYSIFESPSSPPLSIAPGQQKLIKFSNDSFTTPTNTKPANKSKTITLSCLNLSCRDQPLRTLFLNNTEVEYIPDTGAAMSVISEETAKRAGLKVNPYDRSKIRAITEDGKEVPDVPGYVEADVTLENNRLKGVKIIVFKRATNPCLIGREVLSVHPSTQDHFLAMMGLKKPKVPTTLPINHFEEREGFPLECKDSENKHRAPCKTRIENAIERKCLKKSIIESFYDCDRDFDCASNYQINSIEGPITPATTPTEIILIRALDILLEETKQALN